MHDKSFFASIIILFLLAAMNGCFRPAVMKTDAQMGKEEPGFVGSLGVDDVISSLAQIDLVTAEGYHPVRAALVMKKPAYLRMELLPLIGTPDFFLAASPGTMRIFIPSRGEFYTGKPTGDNLAKFLPWKFHLEDIVMIFSGSYPNLGADVSYENSAEGHYHRMVMQASSGHSQIVWVEKNGRMAKLVRKGSDGREIYQVQYEDYEPESPLAGRITIKMADGVTSISVKFIDIKIEKATDLAVFELLVPAGIKTIKLD
jgi:hypothetical protein